MSSPAPSLSADRVGVRPGRPAVRGVGLGRGRSPVRCISRSVLYQCTHAAVIFSNVAAAAERAVAER